MPPIKAISVSVGYGDVLAITLPRNLKHFHDYVVVTAPEDERTQEVCASFPGVRVHVTDAHRRHDAHFNKGLCMTEGFEVLGLDGWVTIIDADIILPEVLPLDQLKIGFLHGAKRRMCEPIERWSPQLDWRTCPHSRDGGVIGFFQCFHASDPAIRGKHPLYDVSFSHAGGCDAFFMEHWPGSHHKVLPIDVLHLGARDTNWFGTSPESRELMDAFLLRNGWTRTRPNIDRSVLGRVGEIKERVDVPGYGISSYELPFTRRNRK